MRFSVSAKKAMAIVAVLVLVATLIPTWLFTVPVKAEVESTSIWNFQKMEAGAVKIEGAVGTVEATEGTGTISVDATTGKLQSRGSDAQFNAGAKIIVPVTGSGRVTVVSYPGYHNYTVGGQEVTEDTFTKEYDTDGTVEIVATSTSYLYSVTVEKDKAVQSEPDVPYAANAENKGATVDKGTVVIRHDGVTVKATKTLTVTERKDNEGNTVYGYKQGGGNDFVIGSATARSIFEITVDKECQVVYPVAQIDSGKSAAVVECDTASALDASNATKVEAAIDTKSGNGSNVQNLVFVAKPGKYYYILAVGSNNPTALDFTAEISKPIDVTFELSNKDAEKTYFDAAEVYFTDVVTGEKKAISNSSLTATLTVNHKYALTTNSGRIAATIDGSREVAAADKMTKTVVIENIPLQTLKGEITGTPAGTVTKLTFTENTTKVATDATIGSDMKYTVDLAIGEYTTSVETTNGGVTHDHASVKENATVDNEVYVELPDALTPVEYTGSNMPQNVTGGTLNSHNGGALIRTAEGTVITIPVTGAANVQVKLNYSGKVTLSAEGVEDVVLETPGGSVSGAIEATSDITITVGTPADTSKGTTTYLENILVTPKSVGIKYEDVKTIDVPSADYPTMKSAVTMINSLTDRPEGEAGRITINLTADLMEQVVMNAPYITLKGNNHTISWYYGVGTFYYSNDASGHYSEVLARDKYSSNEGNGSLWGGTFIVEGNNFIAEDATFKNTYNYELTELEKSDIDPNAKNKFARLKEGVDVSAYSFKERSNAFYIAADNIECYNCNILSSQDTLGRNGEANNNYHTYFSNCVIGGNVDYICGEFSAVFDNCELQWKTYKNDASNNAKVGYIVAPKTSAYVFRNCKVTTAGDEGTDPVVGKYGRTWGANSNASFINTETNGHIDAVESWEEMSSGQKESAIFNEYNNTNEGVEFITPACTNNSLDAVVNYIDTKDVYAIDTVLASWRPVHYMITAQDYSIVEGAETKVEVGSDLTVKSDAQFSRFVMVKVDGTEIAPSNYTAVEGSTVVTLVAEYIATLAAGTHTLDIVSVDGTATTTFEVAATTPVDPTPEAPVTPAAPSTGDATPIALYVIAMLGAAGVVLTSKKRRSVR